MRDIIEESEFQCELLVANMEFLRSLSRTARERIATTASLTQELRIVREHRKASNG